MCIVGVMGSPLDVAMDSESTLLETFDAEVILVMVEGILDIQHGSQNGFHVQIHKLFCFGEL